MYQSTRSNTEVTDKSAVLKGIAPDGGLFVNPEIPKADIEEILKLDYDGMAGKIMKALLPSFTSAIDDGIAAYSKKFDSSEITPVVSVEDNFVLELWHGPTCAFKDLALTVLPYLICEAKNDSGIDKNISILTATSGDTGKAALEGFHDVDGTDITVFFPHGGVSDTQRLQMVTQKGGNVRVCAVRGNFDDCQRGVKEAFAVKQDYKFLSSANSINIGRLVPQVVYYFYAYKMAGHEGIDFIVPTGNFGDILAGYIAKKMGLPIGKLVCASNANNVLYDFLSTGVYDRRREFKKTASPSMDILVSSNLERLLFYASEGDTAFVKKCMDALSSDGVYKVDEVIMDKIRGDFMASWCDEELCKKTIGDVYKNTGYVMDTHTAVAYSASNGGSIVLSTASPFKFPAAVSEAIGKDLTETGLAMPEALKDLDKKEILHKDVIDKDEIVRYSLCI